MLDNVIQFLNIFINFEPISIGELLTFLSTLILLLITWKSVVNVKIANEITKNSQKLQSDQFELSIKPDLTFNIPPIEYTEKENNKREIRSLIKPDHIFQVRNLSDNVAYDLSITTFIYLTNEGWDSYYLFLEKEFGANKARPNIVSHNEVYSLDNQNHLKTTIPHYYLKFNILAYDGTIDHPSIYVFLKYKGKTNQSYEECFELKQRGAVRGKFNSPDEIDLHFHPTLQKKEDIKVALLTQRKKLESDFPEEGKVFYYNL